MKLTDYTEINYRHHAKKYCSDFLYEDNDKFSLPVKYIQIN